MRDLNFRSEIGEYVCKYEVFRVILVLPSLCLNI